MIPLAKVQMCWIPGEENSSDPVSKLFMDPFKQTNTNLFRLGPTCFRTDDEKCVFLEITKTHKTYKPLPDEVFRVKKKKRKKLTEASADENFSNNEVEKIQCARCEGGGETCGAIMLIQTRARKLRERVKIRRIYQWLKAFQ